MITTDMLILMQENRKEIIKYLVYCIQSIQLHVVSFQFIKKIPGSTVILAFAKGEAIIDEEIINNSKYGFETLVKMGEVIGKKGPGNTEGGFLEDEYGYAHI